jgi:hypothetical protein
MEDVRLAASKNRSRSVNVTDVVITWQVQGAKYFVTLHTTTLQYPGITANYEILPGLTSIIYRTLGTCIETRDCR